MKHPALPYVLPFAVFMAFVALGDVFGLGEWEFPFRVFVLSVVLWVFSRHAIDVRPAWWIGSVLVGIAVFFLWIAPDALIPGYRTHWLFQNSITGKVTSSIPEGFHLSTMVLLFRTIRAVIIVPLVEELFWRGWLMRWLINPDFKSVPMGAYKPAAFWITALLFASEHGPYWEVGLLAGIVYNAWIVKTKRLADCIVAHAVTNALLCLYVIGWGKWEYWL
jgi:CAAX prenyl protease-like protein